MVVADTVHAAFLKGAHYFGVEAVTVPTGPDFRADAAAMAAAIDDRTVLVVASAPSYAHGVVDPVAEIAAAAAARGVRCHVDACIGGWVLPYAARLGRPVPPWTFAVDGVTSISLDTHKYAYAPKGTSLLLHRTPELRRPQYFASADWPGYTMLNSTLQSTKSGGPLAGAWAVVRTLGDEGYLPARARGVRGDRPDRRRRRRPRAAARAWPPPTRRSSRWRPTAPATPSRSATRWPRTAGTSSRRCPTPGSRPRIHLSVSAATLAHVDEFLDALGKSVMAAVESGPVVVDDGVRAFIEALDPAALSDADFDGLLVAAGLVGDAAEGLAVPERMAEVNALLDLASPTMREALLIAFLDRLQRPTRRLTAEVGEMATPRWEKWRRRGGRNGDCRWRSPV